MDVRDYSVVEMLLFFGLMLALGFWQLYSVSQAKRRRLERGRAERPES